jgi:hypothetical protein
MNKLSRRTFMGLAAAAGVGSLAAAPKTPETPAATATAPATTSTAQPAPLPPVPDEFPTQPPALAREMVSVSHFNLKRVNELLEAHPTLANAAWDWGFGDWETALGAASHIGNAPIAQALLAHGARPSIFSAAMLGQLAVVKAFIEASPGVQATHGPHSITLLAHARAGGDAAKSVLEYLTAVGGADPVPAAVPLAPELAAKYTGIYEFGARPADRIEIAIEKGSVTFKRTGMMFSRNLTHLGEHAFHPAGATGVRVRFTMAAENVGEVAVFDPGLVVTARRVS